MPIVLVRIDGRLIHGQILEGWLPYSGASMIIVANNAAAQSAMQKKIMEMAVPSDIKLRIRSVAEAVNDLKSEDFGREKVMLLFSSPDDALEAYEKGIKYERINLGNVCYKEGRKQLTPSVALNDEDVESLQALVKKGVSVDVRGVPLDKKESIASLLKKYSELCRS